MGNLVEVRELKVTARNDAGETVAIVKDISFAIAKGEVLALIGESGSGKTTIALALMGYARGGCRLAGGSIRIGETDVLNLNHHDLVAMRGRQVAYIAQSAASAFNPSKTIMDQVVEAALVHGLMDRAAAEAKAVGLFEALALPQPRTIGARYPHQVSGGQLQRLMAAMALITDPELVILDEPTTALDVTTQIEVLRAFKKVVRERGTTAVYVSHDLAVVAQMADQIIVLKQGDIREAGATEQILHAPADAYTQTLMAAARPDLRPEAVAKPAQSPLLEIRSLSAGYGKADNILKAIDVTIQPGSTLGVIGESGSGKSTLARVIAGLLPASAGELLFNGQPLAPNHKGRTQDQLRRIQIVFQNADTALNPAHSVAQILGRPLEFYHDITGAAQRKRILQLLDLIRLPASLADRRCSELSGGQKQRINLARALAAEPDLILCDEVTSALDTVVGAAILDLMADLKRELNVTYVFISHDISTVRSICDDIVVLYSGQMVEQGARETYRVVPYHPYTDLLIASVPEMQAGWLEATRATQAHAPVPAGAALRHLCPFLSRCPVKIAGTCETTPPPRIRLDKGSTILCHHTEEELRHWQAGTAFVTGGT